MKRNMRTIVLVGIAAAIGAPAAQAGSTWSGLKPSDVGRPSDVVRHAPRDVVRDVYRHAPRDATRLSRPTGFSDGRLGTLGLPWDGG
jgi:hypothetical protein